jgi:hypothetical protein
MAQLPEDIIDRITAMERRLRQLSTAVTVRTALTRVAGSSIRISDTKANEIIADDANSGGLGRPWLAMLPPQILATAHWPQTTSTAFTPVARSYNVVWQLQVRLLAQTAVSAGATGQVQVFVNGQPFGDVTQAGTVFDHLGPVCPQADFPNVFGTRISFEIQAKVTSASGTVFVQPQLMYGAQS